MDKTAFFLTENSDVLINLSHVRSFSCYPDRQQVCAFFDNGDRIPVYCSENGIEEIKDALLALGINVVVFSMED